MIIACELIKLAPIDSAQAPPLPAEAHELFDLTPPDLIDSIVTEDGAHNTGLTVNMIHVYLTDPATGAPTGDIVVGMAKSAASL